MLPIRQIFQEMVAEKLRLSLTVLAVAWATMCIAVMLSVGEGLRHGVIKMTQSGSGNLILVNGGVASKTFGAFHAGKALRLKADDLPLMTALPGVDMAIPSASWPERPTVGDNVSWKKPLAVTQSYLDMTHLQLMPGGRWFNPYDRKDARKVIVLGYSTAAELFDAQSDSDDIFGEATLRSNPVGKTVKLGEEVFTVIGVMKKTSADIESGAVNYASFVPYGTWQRYYPNVSIDTINVLPQKGISRTQLTATIRTTLARKHGASIDDLSAIDVTDRLSEQKEMQSFLVGLQSFLGIIGFVTLAVAGVGIANVMYATVKRSTRDIGVRMAVGATPGAIRAHYLVQSLMTMSLGGGVGILVSYALVTGISAIDLSGNPMFDALGQPVPELSFLVVFIVIITLALIGVAAAWFPANRAASVTPLEALQSE